MKRKEKKRKGIRVFHLTELQKNEQAPDFWICSGGSEEEISLGLFSVWHNGTTNSIQAAHSSGHVRQIMTILASSHRKYH